MDMMQKKQSAEQEKYVSRQGKESARQEKHTLRQEKKYPALENLNLIDDFLMNKVSSLPEVR